MMLVPIFITLRSKESIELESRHTAFIDDLRRDRGIRDALKREITALRDKGFIILDDENISFVAATYNLKTLF